MAFFVSFISIPYFSLGFGINIPFNIADDKNISQSIENAIKTIVSEDEKVAIENKKLEIETETLKRTIELKKQQTLFKESYPVLPNYKVYAEDGLQKSLPDYIEKNRRFKDKPTLVMTWAYNWCRPCIKKIDEILKTDLAKKYNVILVNRNPETEINFQDIRVQLATKSPEYNKDAIVLFDRNNEFATMDNNSAPIFIWLDKNLKIVDMYPGYGITTEEIGDTLLKVEQNTKN